MAFTCDAEEAVPAIQCQWCCENSGFGAMSVGSPLCKTIKGDSVVHPPVQLYVALVHWHYKPRIMPYNQHCTHL
jgi:hypothetical protein